MFFYTFGGNPDLNDNFSYILFGVIISEYIQASWIINPKTNS